MSQRILIAEDEAISLKHLTYALEKEGYTVTGVKDGIEAFSLFEKNAYDVIIADIKMPGMDGLTLLDKIKAKEPETEVIIMTAYGSEEIKEDAYRRGAFYYYEKPIDIPHLISKVNSLGIVVPSVQNSKI